MTSFFEKLSFTNRNVKSKPETEQEIKQTPKHLQIFGEKTVDLFCKDLQVDGLESFKKFKEENPEQKFILSAAHLNNLDVPAALKIMGPELNIQITGESVLLEKIKYLGHRLMINLAGRENFTALDYKENKDGKFGSFNPENFNELEEKMTAGKTPWIAAHPFSLDGKMKKASIGPVYLAAKTGAMIIPSALEVAGGSVNLEGMKESAKSLLDRSTAKYHIGHPLKFPTLDVSIIDTVLGKRAQGEEVSREEMTEFVKVHNQLKEQAEILAQTISVLLPEEKRGYYSQEEKNFEGIEKQVA